MHRKAIPLICLIVVFADVRLAIAQPLLRRLEARLRQVIPPAVPGYPVNPDVVGPPRLGIGVDGVGPEAVVKYGLVVRSGALITRIEPGSAADRAGLPLGGVIVAVDGVRIDTPDELVNMVRSARTGQTMELTYYQGARLFRKRLELGPSAFARRNPLADVPPLPGAAEALPMPESAAGPAVGPERPLLDRLGRALGEFSPVPLGDPSPLVPPIPSARDKELELLRKQVEALQMQVDSLTKRLAELEKARTE